MKNILVLGAILICYCMIGNYVEEKIQIPEDAIRIRILANSNTEYDQTIKNRVKENIEDYMWNLLNDAGSLNEAEEKIVNNLDAIEEQLDGTLNSLNYNLPYKINYGLNYFPEKKYKGVTYESGYYKSVLITLGKGEGDNWWCVLFPPLCLIEAEESTEVEYKSFVKELIDKYV